MFTARSAIRSSSVLILSTVAVRRKSTATGWCSARILRHSSSILTSRTLISISLAATSDARSPCRSTRAWQAFAIISSTRDDWSRISRSNNSRSRSKCFDIFVSQTKFDFEQNKNRIISPEPPGNIIFSLLTNRVREQLVRRSGLDQFALVKERRLIRHAGRLLHIVRHNHNGVLVSQLKD